MKLNAARVVVRKAAGILEIYDGPALVKKFACITGGNPGDKSIEGDRRTPNHLIAGNQSEALNSQWRAAFLACFRISLRFDFAWLYLIRRPVENERFADASLARNLEN